MPANYETNEALFFTEKYVSLIVANHYNIHVTVTPLNGYDELNFLLQDVNDKKYICKIATDEHSFAFLDAQVKIINHLSTSAVATNFQCYLLNSEGNELTILRINNMPTNFQE